MNIAFRQANESDAPSVANVYLASRKTFLPFAPLVHSDREVREWIAGVLIPSGRVTVAAIEATIVGMMAVSDDGHYGWIDHLYLDPARTRRGIGGRFVRLAKSSLRSPIRLYAFQANATARRFYERHGFHPIAFSDGHDNEEHCPDVLYEFTPAASTSSSVGFHWRRSSHS